ncbi:MAG: twin-arginine translocase TatA/TatE family subunit [Lentisphaeria bacterium]|nr:twin-arginine translocase TatA/TatE family subunit [Victivallales bacterium]MBR6058602.1 twin-arginine translocase TatA/TatE family subunit [Victivallales bacterium]MCR4573311.1 twin-arginine translocase TatA/TatE family subunit [Lentisphaeria bacterium]
MFGMGMGEWLIIFLIILLLFGAKRLPEIARSLGKATNEFKKAKDELTSYTETPSQPTYQQPPQQRQPAQPQQQNDNNQPQA